MLHQATEVELQEHASLMPQSHVHARRDEIFRLIEADVPPNESGTGYSPFSVRMLLQYSVLDTFDQIQAISSTASKEYR